MHRSLALENSKGDLFCEDIYTRNNVCRVSVEKCLDALDHGKKGTINLEEFEVL